MITVTKEQLRALDPCDLPRRLALFANSDTLNVQQAKDAGASISDILWVAGALGMKRKCVQAALRFAQQVAHLNLDPRVQAALDATRNWLDNPTAAYAAYAAYAADAAADAQWVIVLEIFA